MKWPPDICTFCGSTKKVSECMQLIEGEYISYFNCDSCADLAAHSPQAEIYHQDIIRGKWELRREKKSQS